MAWPSPIETNPSRFGAFPNARPAARPTEADDVPSRVPPRGTPLAGVRAKRAKRSIPERARAEAPMSGSSESSTRARRYVAIDGLRFVAAMGVVAHHYAGLAGAPLAESLFAKNYLFVDFFFAISGFVIFHNYGGRIDGLAAYGGFLRNRLARVYPLHALTFAAYGLLALTVWRDKADRSFVDAAAAVPNIVLTHAWGTTDGTSFNYPSWSISAEWLAYLLFPAVAWVVARGGSRAALALAALIVAALELASRAGLIEPWTTLTWHFGALRALPTFLFGAALARAVERIPFRSTGFALAWTSFGCAVAAMALGLDDRAILALLMASLTTTALAERDGATGLLTRPAMARLGDLSYAIYMIHPLLAVALVNLAAMKLLHLSGAALALWCLVCGLAGNIGLAAVVHRRVEVPARDWLRQIRWPSALAYPATRRVNGRAA
jgi:peptidoglycan/LPS O-acetylase OafA/YrhL